MPYLRTPSVRVSLSGPLSTILDHLERSVSWDENFMLMEVLISILSSTSGGSSGLERQISLMLTAATRTLCHLEAALGVVGTTQQRMETLLQEDSHGQASLQLCEMAIRGARLSALRVSQSFGSCLKHWLRRNFAPPTPPSGNSPIGGSLSRPFDTSQTPALTFDLEEYLSWMHGENHLLVTVP